MDLVRTVLGDVAAADIGPVQFHEHVLFDIAPLGASGEPSAPILTWDRFQTDYWSNANPANAHQTDVAVATAELRAFALAGGSLIVDQSVAGLARDAIGLSDVSRASGVHLVAAAGTYTAPFLSAAQHAMTTADMADLFTEEVETGLDGTKVRAGLIGEIGCSWPLEPVEHHALLAAADAQRRTGVSISVHPGRDPRACPQIIDILDTAGADLSRVVLCHMDRTYPDGRGIAALLDHGVCVEWDFFGVEQSYYWMGNVELPTDLGRLRFIDAMVAAGHGDRIIISQDICTRTRLRKWGGHGYGHILTNVVPLMHQYGFDPTTIQNLVRGNALRLLTLKK